MNLLESHAVISIIVALFVWELVKQVIAYFFKKVAGDEYLTKKDCEACSQRQKSKDDGVTIQEIFQCMQVMRGILLVVAIKSGMKAEELTDLTKL